MTIKKSLKTALITYLVIICCIITPFQRANANAYGVAVSVAQWVNNAVSISATVGGAYRTVVMSPKSPQVAALIIAGAGGAYVGDYLYKKYGDTLDTWAWDATHENITVKLKSTAAAQDVFCTSANKMASKVCSDAGAGAYQGVNAGGSVICIAPSTGAPAAYYGGGCPSTGYGTNQTYKVPAADIANQAIADAKSGNVNAQKLVVDATAANVKTTDFTDAANNPTTNDTTFDPSSILAAIQSLFAMMQNLLTNLLDAIKSLAEAIFKPIVDIIKQVWDFLKESWDWFKNTATAWKDAVVTEYKDVKDKVDHYFNDEPVMTDTPLPESNPTLKDPTEFDKDYIKVTAQCPDDVERQIPVGNMSFTLRFPMSPLCDFLSTYARPVIILMAYITAALSIGNAFRVGG